jgi:protein-tyrosine phosphatase
MALSTMIDVHSHYLPNVDDGPEEMETSLAMARMAVADGISYAMMTPHIVPGEYDNDRRRIRRAFESFRKALKEADIPLRIGMAAEVRLDLEIVPMLGRDEIPYLGWHNGEQVLLLEFPHTHIPAGAPRFVERLLKQKIRPIIAHPERNRAILRDVDEIAPFVSLGCYLQITAGSLTGHFGRGPRKRARQLLERDVLKVLATDAHNLKLRPPLLRAGVDAAAQIIGRPAAEDLVYRNPMSIVFGRRLPALRLDANSLADAGFAIST